MMGHVRKVAALVVAGYAAALVYVGEEILAVVDPAPITDAEIEDAEEEVAATLTGLDAERWVNQLNGDHHDKDAYVDGDNCGNYDCRWCWVNATGATG